LPPDIPDSLAEKEAEPKSAESYVTLTWIGQFVPLPVPTLVSDTMLPDELAFRNEPSF